MNRAANLWKHLTPEISVAERSGEVLVVNRASFGEWYARRVFGSIAAHGPYPNKKAAMTAALKLV